MLFKQRKYLKGVIDFRKAWKTYSEAADAIKALTPPGQETNPELPLFEEVRSSVDFGMGVFHFGVSSVPPAYRWIVEGFGSLSLFLSFSLSLFLSFSLSLFLSFSLSLFLLSDVLPSDSEEIEKDR